MNAGFKILKKNIIDIFLFEHKKCLEELKNNLEAHKSNFHLTAGSEKSIKKWESESTKLTSQFNSADKIIQILNNTNESNLKEDLDLQTIKEFSVFEISILNNNKKEKYNCFFIPVGKLSKILSLKIKDTKYSLKALDSQLLSKAVGAVINISEHDELIGTERSAEGLISTGKRIPEYKLKITKIIC